MLYPIELRVLLAPYDKLTSQWGTAAFRNGNPDDSRAGRRGSAAQRQGPAFKRDGDVAQLYPLGG